MFYEFLYTGIAQMIAAYSPSAVFAALVNPLVINVMVLFAGVFIPYAQLTAFWRYCESSRPCFRPCFASSTLC